MDEHPEIYLRDGAFGQRAALAGTRLDVWQVIQTVRDHDNSVEDAADYLGVSVAKVRAAVSYYAVNGAEVDAIAERETSAADQAEASWRRERGLLGP